MLHISTQDGYIRFLAKMMNQTNNGYSAFDRNGRSRGPKGGAPGPFRLEQYPRSRKLIRAELRKPRHRGRP